MKTLKKTLCLVLAVVMVVGVLILPAYAADDDYDDAIEALQNYGVLQGYPDGDLHKDANITRGQMAAIIYRIMTGDTTSTDAEVAVKFGPYASIYTDANVAPWAKGYIGFCSNQGVLKGYPGGTVQANKQISGYEVQAMLLRALGYDSNGEYTGENWQYKVLADATKAGITDKVKDLDPAKVTPRGAVAQLTYNAATQTNRVAPTLVPNVGYDSIGEKLMTIGAVASGEDKWGAPSKIYTITYTWPDNDPVKETTVADEPELESYVPVTQAAVYKAAGLNPSTASNVVTWTNGYKGTTANVNYAETSLDPSAAMGGQGRWTRVYKDRIVYVDTFLSKVTKVTKEVKINGKTAIPNSYDTKTFYNNYATSNAWYTDDINVEKTTAFAKNDMLASNAIATTGSFTDTNQIKSLENAAKATTASVTVNAIVKDKDNNITGFVGTNGKTYLYNCTYAYKNGAAGTTDPKLDEEAIGTTYTLYLDGQGNVLGVETTKEAKNEGVGVVIDSDAGRIKGGEYYGEVTVLTPDNTQVKIQFVQSTPEAFDTENDAADAAEAMIGNLIEWEPVDDPDYSKYSDITVANSSTPEAVVGQVIEAGDADALGKTTGLFNDDTVFFVANYKMQNSKGGWVFTNYSVIEGFQKIMDMSTSGTVVDNPNVAVSDSQLRVEYIVDDDGWVEYVLVINAVNKSTNKVEPVDNYAFLADPYEFVKVYDDYYQYNAVINGTANQPLRVNYDAVGDITQTGLYTYSDYTNEGWRGITLSTNTYAGNAYTYNAGVLYNVAEGTAASTATQFYAVVDNVAIYLVDPDTGVSTKVDADLDTIQDVYGDSANAIWFQTNQYGWINLIYVEIPETASKPGDTPDDPLKGELTFTGTLTANANSTTITVASGNLTGTGTAFAGKDCTVKAVVKLWYGYEYRQYTTGTADEIKATLAGTNSVSEITTKLPLGPGNYIVEVTFTASNGQSETFTLPLNVA